MAFKGPQSNVVGNIAFRVSDFKFSKSPPSFARGLEKLQDHNVAPPAQVSPDECLTFLYVVGFECEGPQTMSVPQTWTEF